MKTLTVEKVDVVKDFIVFADGTDEMILTLEDFQTYVYEPEDGIYTVVEGSYEDGTDHRQYPLSHEGFEQAYAEALEGWNSPKPTVWGIGKCVIYLVEDGKVLYYRRPDMINFEYRENDNFTNMYFEDTYIYAKESLDSLKENDPEEYAVVSERDAEHFWYIKQTFSKDQ